MILSPERSSTPSVCSYKSTYNWKIFRESPIWCYLVLVWIALWKRVTHDSKQSLDENSNLRLYRFTCTSISINSSDIAESVDALHFGNSDLYFCSLDWCWWHWHSGRSEIDRRKERRIVGTYHRYQYYSVLTIWFFLLKLPKSCKTWGKQSIR